MIILAGLTSPTVNASQTNRIFIDIFAFTEKSIWAAFHGWQWFWAALWAAQINEQSSDLLLFNFYPIAKSSIYKPTILVVLAHYLLSGQGINIWRPSKKVSSRFSFATFLIFKNPTHNQFCSQTLNSRKIQNLNARRKSFSIWFQTSCLVQVLSVELS